jgi:hypothetical protein
MGQVWFSDLCTVLLFFSCLHESKKQMYMCVRGIKFAPVSMIFLLDSGTVLMYGIFCYSFYYMSF